MNKKYVFLILIFILICLMSSCSDPKPHKVVEYKGTVTAIESTIPYTVYCDGVYTIFIHQNNGMNCRITMLRPSILPFDVGDKVRLKIIKWYVTDTAWELDSCIVLNKEVRVFK